MKKILNDANRASEDAIDDMVLSQPQVLKRIEDRRIVVPC
jgi:hypothetical protein